MWWKGGTRKIPDLCTKLVGIEWLVVEKLAEQVSASEDATFDLFCMPTILQTAVIISPNDNNSHIIV